MLYTLLKFPARIALYFYCRSITITNKQATALRGPVLIAANHPNSFLDAVLLATVFKHPIHSLTRGDVFANPFFKLLLKWMNMLAIYRTSEGVENLGHNYSTFTACQHIFSRNGIVLIFSEGLCVNEWRLRPLKKGTARIAMNAWQQNIPLQVLPVGINYSCFKKFGKNIILNFGSPISSGDFKTGVSEGKLIGEFNAALYRQLKDLVIEINRDDVATKRNKFFIRQPFFMRFLLFIPSVSGWLLHSPLYYAVEYFIRKRSKDHYDSVMVGLLFILYPVYLGIIILLLFLATKSSWSLLLLLIFPFTAWAHLQLKRQL